MPSDAAAFEGPVVTGQRMRNLVSFCERIASRDVPVLLGGETGTGKEVLARHIHAHSARKDRPLFVLNCAALPLGVLESALFGHEKGAFTGAEQARQGIFEMAHGATVFLDEVGELPKQAQAALLRVMDGGSFSRVGSTRELRVDVRVISATHRDLATMSTHGDFREDLYYRLNTVCVELPALRDRKDEVLPLAEHFLSLARRRGATRAQGFSEKTQALLLSHSWPGNVRELRNAIDRACLLAATSLIEPEDLPDKVRVSPLVGQRLSPAQALAASPKDKTAACGRPTFRDSVRALEVKLIERALSSTCGNVRRAADLLGMPLRTLNYKMRAYDL